MTEENNKIIKKLDGVNIDIDLTTEKEDIHWDQDKCLWNVESNFDRRR